MNVIGRSRGLTKIDVDAALEQPTEYLDNLGPGHVELARERERLGHVLRVEHGLAHALLEEAQLCALRNGVADGELDHVVRARQQRDHVVENPRPLHVRAVLEVELLRLVVVVLQRPREQANAVLGVGKGEVSEYVLLLALREVPKHNDAVGEDEKLGEVLGIGRQPI
jgi:hypothetical protein